MVLAATAALRRDRGTAGTVGWLAAVVRVAMEEGERKIAKDIIIKCIQLARQVVRAREMPSVRLGWLDWRAGYPTPWQNFLNIIIISWWGFFLSFIYFYTRGTASWWRRGCSKKKYTGRGGGSVV